MCSYCLEAQAVMAMWENGHFIALAEQEPDELFTPLLCMEASPLQDIRLSLHSETPDSTVLALRLAAYSLSRPLYPVEKLLHQQYCQQVVTGIHQSNNPWPKLSAFLSQLLIEPECQLLSTEQLQPLLNEALHYCNQVLQQYYINSPLSVTDALYEQDNQQQAQEKQYRHYFPLLYLACELLIQYQPTAQELIQLVTKTPCFTPSLFAGEPLWLQRSILSRLVSRLGLSYALPCLAEVRFELCFYLLKRHNFNRTELAALLKMIKARKDFYSTSLITQKEAVAYLSGDIYD
ncbi:MAG: hypothetical protein KKF22_05880 [Gammaproteobacteria bacterium]|nr:hypothetical protein [Gammaproteobacteria bacterium]